MNERPGNEVGHWQAGRSTPCETKVACQRGYSEGLAHVNGLNVTVGNEPLVTRFMTVEPFTGTVLVADVECVLPLCDPPGADAVGEGDSVGT